jgi:hypothetical protein
MKTIACLAFLLVGFQGYGQGAISLETIQALLKKEKPAAYIFVRGTRRKAAMIGDSFNIRLPQATHVGIGISGNNGVYIYHVADVEQDINGSALRRENLLQFFGEPDVFYGSVWRISLTSAQLALLEQHCHAFLKKKIWFDAQFNLQENDSLYCSEFCAKLLNDLAEPSLLTKPVVKTISNPFIAAYLGRTEFLYHPVDFFITMKAVRFWAEVEENKLTTRVGKEK